MVSVRMQNLNVRVFKWNEKLPLFLESSKGLILLCVNRKPKLHCSSVKETRSNLKSFYLVSLSDQESIKELVFDAIRLSCLDGTTAKLREAVCEYLLGYFAFDIQPSSSPGKPRLVIVVDVDVSKRTDGTRKRHLPSGFSSEIEETQDSRDDASKSVKKRRVGNAIQEDTHDDASKSVKKTRVGNVVPYKKALLRSRMQQRKQIKLRGILRRREQIKLRRILWWFMEKPVPSTITPIVAGEPKGLSQVEIAVKEKKFYGRESEDVCSICLDGISTGMRVAQSPCSHIFHRDCLFRWLPRDSRCPMCRNSCARKVQS